jgi:hypothetical protein
MIQVGRDRAMVAPTPKKPIAADKKTNPTIILCNPHEKTGIRMLAGHGKSMALSWSKFVAAPQLFSGSWVN